MVDVIYDGIQCFCLPDCACCKACHKRLNEMEKCPEGNEHCDPNCNDYAEIWDETELKEELAQDDDKKLEDAQ